MTSYPHHPSSPESIQLQTRGNKKLWIILGSIIGLLVIVMGGCVACGALIGLSRLSDDRPTASDSRPPRERTGGGELAATSWRGTLKCDDGDSLPVVFKFADTGNPLYDYQTSNGLKEVELTSPGQSLRFVPPEGGVTNIVLDSISVSSDRMSHTMRLSRERSAGGTMIQGRSIITTEAALSASMLEVETTIRSSSAASQPGYVIPDESAAVCRGTLSRD